MMLKKLFILTTFITLPGIAAAELKALGDDVLSEVSGQSGITADLANKFSIGELAYFDDGRGIALQGVKMSSAADPAQLAEYRLKLDILENGDFELAFNSENVARFEIEDIRFVDTPGSSIVASDPSLGGFFIDYRIDQGLIRTYNRGNDPIGPNNVSGGLYDINLVIRDGKFGYRTNGNEFFMDGLSLDINSMGTVFGVTPAGDLNISMPNLLAELKVDAVRFNDLDQIPAPGTPDSLGSLWLNTDLNSNLFIRAGGAEGVSGMTINVDTTINRMDIAWGDDTNWADSGYWVGALGMTGRTSLENLTVDILEDEDVDVSKNYGLGLALAFDRLAIDVHVQDFVLGETKTNIDNFIGDSSLPIKSIGSFDIGLTFADAIYNGVARTNKVLVQAGGNTNAGSQGLRLDTQLSLLGASNESNFVYTVENDYFGESYSLMLSGLEGFLDGDITIDITEAGTVGQDTFYNGLRLGFEDVAFGYQIEGIRVAESTGDKEDLKNNELRSAQRVDGFSGLAGLFAAPSLEGDLNGHITLGAGGREGDEGITINSDISVSDGVMATYLQADGTGGGVWLSGLNYDVHLRDMMLDVTSDGLKIYETESWSKLDVTDFRIGDKVSGPSFGGIVVESYEMGSETVISAGGAGEVCIGGVGSDAVSCQADNGRWEDRGIQGLTVSSKRHLKAANEPDDKRNRFTWHTDRDVDGFGVPDKSTGLKLVFDNYTTNDGNDLTDDFGIQTQYNMDIARAPVIKKSTGLDSNNVYGEEGWEKVMLPDGSYEYKDPSLMTAADRANRPVGVAIRTNTQFKELDFGGVNLGHHSGGDSTLLYGLKLQNFNVTTDITATPLD